MLVNHFVQIRRDALNGVVHFLQFGKYLLTNTAQPDGVVGPHEQRGTQLLLQGLDVSAQGGLGHIQVCGSRGETSAFDRLQKALQLDHCDRHGRRLPPSFYLFYYTISHPVIQSLKRRIQDVNCLLHKLILKL